MKDTNKPALQVCIYHLAEEPQDQGTLELASSSLREAKDWRLRCSYAPHYLPGAEVRYKKQLSLITK